MNKEQYKYSELTSKIIGCAMTVYIPANLKNATQIIFLPVRAFISIENKITSKHEYAVGVSYQ